MLDLDILLDYVMDDCEIDIYEIDSDYNCIAKGLTIDEAREWHENHTYELCSFEPIQRKDIHGEVVYGIVFNVEGVEDND